MMSFRVRPVFASIVQIHAKFMCRGYRSEMELRWEFITAEASVLMRKYLGLDISKYKDNSQGPSHEI